MSSLKNGSVRGSNGRANGDPPTHQAASSALPAPPNECVFLSLREAADLHGISHSYLSRRVRNGKPAKGYDLRSYVLFKEGGSQPPEEKTIFGFAFPPGYTPAHSTVDDDQDERPVNGAKGAGATVLSTSEPESQKTSPARESPEDESSDPPTEVENDIAEMKEALAELKETILQVNQALRAIAEDVSEEQDRRTQLDDTLMKALKELLQWKRSEKARQARLEEDHKEHREILHEVPRELREESDALSNQIDHLNSRIGNLRGWIDTVLNTTEQDLKAGRKKAFRKLSDELTEKIEEPMQELLTLHRDNSSEENVWATTGGLAAALIATRILDERQIATLIDSAGQVLAEHLSLEDTDPAAPESGTGTQDGDGASQ